MHVLFISALIVATVGVWRWIGLASQPPRTMFWQRFLAAVPIAVFTGLVMLPLARDLDVAGVRSVALAVAGAVMWRTRQAGLSVLAGLAVLWLITK